MIIASVNKDSFVPSSPTHLPFLSLAWLHQQEPKYRVSRSGENGNTPLIFSLGESVQPLTMSMQVFVDGPWGG